MFERSCVIVAAAAPSLRVAGGGAAVLALASSLTFFLGAPEALATGFVVRDDLDRPVAFAQHPQRIVSLLPSLTETICALDSCGRLVATDRYSDWPPQVKALPKAGGIDDAEIELIVKLEARPGVAEPLAAHHRSAA